MPSLTYTVPTPPSNMSLKARLAYAHLFFEDSDWHCVKTIAGQWIITMTPDLEDADVFPDEASFVDWLEGFTDENIESDPKTFLTSFLKWKEVRINDLFDDELVEAVRNRLERTSCCAAADPDELIVETSAVETSADDEEDDEDD